ncbi:allantoate amidohydrolase [uncultured Parvibaculum sp.]|uniref:allantoate amidohydrolase n=1 Tax=uncultured Parvibaculum sp. TaxID=291828 RepID=UPI0030D9F875
METALSNIEVLSPGARAVARCDIFGKPPYSETPAMLTRRFLTPAHTAAIASLQRWMRKADMSVTLDPLGNLIGRYEGNTAGAPALVIGSHIDTVRDAGRYDGALGVMLGLSCIEQLAAAKRRLPFAIELVAFGDEEGSRFPSAMIGSRAMAGLISDYASIAALEDEDGVMLADALERFGLDPSSMSGTARAPESVLAYLEAHIEQGPQLEAEDLALGVVTGIAAQLRFRVSFTGTAGHAGTTPMGLRQDALACAAEAILAIEEMARQQAVHGAVATVGSIDAKPGAANVIAGETGMSLDIRALDGTLRDEMARHMMSCIADIAARRNVGVEFEQLQDLPPSPCDPALSGLLEEALGEMGLPPFRLASGAGHDAAALAAIAPMAMLFIRCAGGISHNPAEAVDPADADLAVEAMLRFIDRLEASTA